MNALSLARVDLSALSPAERIDAAIHAERVVALMAGRPGVVLHRCERLEVYTSDHRDARAVLSVSGFANIECLTECDAFRHLVRVASGLASRIPGEPHILGQVRTALAVAQQSGTASPNLVRVFASAIRAARVVRDRSSLGAREGGYAARAVAAVVSAFARPCEVHALVVGSGAAARDVAMALSAASIGRLTISGRHAPSVAAIAHDVRAEGIELSAVLAGHFTCDAVITAASPRQPLLTVDALEVMGARLVVDLGFVPNVAPCDGGSAIPILRLEDLVMGPRSDACDVAERLVEREVARFAASIRSCTIPRRTPERKAS